VIATISGHVLSTQANSLVVDCSGVGYSINVTPQTASSATVGQKLLLHTRLIVREDSMTLYGFEEPESANLFDAVTSVSGIGPKSGLAIIAALSPEQISSAVETENDAVFRSVPGIGPKTAKLLVVSLAGKVRPQGGTERSNLADELISALVGLGYAEKVATPAVREALASSQDKPAALRIALAIISGKS
jgi:holliday junction DNA helicase RuvA